MEKRTDTKRIQSLTLLKVDPFDTNIIREISLLHTRVLGSQSDVSIEDCVKVDINHIYYVFNPENIVVGYAVVQTEDKVANILALGVDDRLRQKGIGKMLIQPVIASNNAVRLAVHQNNKNAIKFYHKMGFLPEAVLVNYYGDEEHGFSMICSK